MKHSLLILLLAPISISAHSAYKCVDAQGHVTYQTTACPADAAQTKTKIDSSNSAEAKNASSKTASKQEEFVNNEPIDSSQAMLIRQNIASAISSLTPIKVMTMDYYSVNGDWPTQLSDLGFDEDNMKSSTVNSVKMGGNGEFIAELNSSFGDNKLLVFSPESVMGGTNVEWKCYANFTSELLSVVGHPICESSAKPEISAVTPRSYTKTKNSNKDFLRPGEKRMLDKYEERGRKLIEAKKRSVEEYEKRKGEEEGKENPTAPTYYPQELRNPTF